MSAPAVGAALAALDAGALVADLAALVQVPSVTGDERAALELLARQARALGLDAELRAHDLTALRAHPDHPGEEAPRDELLDLRVRAPRGGGAPGAGGSLAGGGAHEGRGATRPRLALCGHVDVVAGGTVPWVHGGAFSGAVADGAVHGRGAIDMKGALVAMVHAVAALHRAGVTPTSEPEVLVVASEEDGGQGAFAALGADAAYDACLITEPTTFDVVCAQAGALTFTGEVRGVAAHAGSRLDGASAVDRYLPVHAALQALEQRLNSGVAHSLMAALPLPYPVSVGRLRAGEWASTVPDRLVFEGRAPVRVGEDEAAARAAVEAAVAATGMPVGIAWTGGQFASAATPEDHPLTLLVQGAASAVLGRPARTAGVPWGADMRLFIARGIPTVMCGAGDIARAHAVDEHLAVDDLVRLAELLVRVLCAPWPARVSALRGAPGS